MWYVDKDTEDESFCDLKSYDANLIKGECYLWEFDVLNDATDSELILQPQ